MKYYKAEMEHKRKRINSVLDEEIIDFEVRGHSLDETIDEHIEYVYNGSFSFAKMAFRSIIKLICPCCSKKREQIEVN